MEIQKSNNVQFGARYISPAKVKAKAGQKWKDLDVSFIKFETNKDIDKQSLDCVECLWGKKNYSAGISEEARILGGNSQIYALTTQKDGFDRVEPQKILGIMSTDKIKIDKPSVQLFKIGTNPSYAYAQKRRSRDIKHIASSLIESFRDYVKSRSKAEVVVNYADPEDMKFLSKVGLEPKHKEFVEVLSK